MGVIVVERAVQVIIHIFGAHRSHTNFVHRTIGIDFGFQRLPAFIDDGLIFLFGQPSMVHPTGHGHGKDSGAGNLFGRIGPVEYIVPEAILILQLHQGIDMLFIMLQDSLILGMVFWQVL